MENFLVDLGQTAEKGYGTEVLNVVFAALLVECTDLTEFPRLREDSLVNGVIDDDRKWFGDDVLDVFEELVTDGIMTRGT